MSKITGNELVHPKISTKQALKGCHTDGNAYGDVSSSGGLTIRQHFASLAMQGLLVRYKIDQRFGNSESFPMVAEMSVQQADALIAELNKEK